MIPAQEHKAGQWVHEDGVLEQVRSQCERYAEDKVHVREGGAKQAS